MRISNSGMSIMNVMVGMALTAILSVFVMQLTDNQNKSLKYFMQKSDSIELKSAIITALRKSSVCHWQLATTNHGQTINTTNPANVPTEININKIYMGDNTSTPVLAAINHQASSSLQVSTIKYKKIRHTTGEEYTGVLEISFDSSKLARPIRPVEIAQNIVIDSTAGTVSSRPIKKCGPAAAEMTMLGAQDPGIQGKTGDQACADIGKACVRVTSYNFIREDAAGVGTHGVRVCAGWYNQNLPGVENGTDMDNVHSCSALLGQYTTYLHVNVVRCNAYFSVICN